MSKLVVVKGPGRKYPFAVNFAAVAYFHETQTGPGGAVIRFIQGRNENVGCPAKELHSSFPDAVAFENCIDLIDQFNKRLTAFVNKDAVIKVTAFETAPVGCEIRLRGDKEEHSIQVAEPIETVLAKLAK